MATTDSVLSVAQIRAAEEATMAEVPEAVLMDRAAAAVAGACRAILDPLGGVEGAAVAALVGGGNNGGDALLAAAELGRAGAQVIAVATSATVHERGAAALADAGGSLLPADSPEAASAVTEASLVIDGMVGIGSRPGLRDHAAELASRVSCPVVAVDLPSGLDADSGEVRGPHVRATLTVTFTARKACLVEQPAATAAGLVTVADVGVALNRLPLN